MTHVWTLIMLIDVVHDTNKMDSWHLSPKKGFVPKGGTMQHIIT